VTVAGQGPTTDELLELMPFARHLGVTLTEATPERVRAELAWRPELCTAGGTLHGGAMMSLADTAGAVCAYLNLPAAKVTTTTTSTTHLVRGCRAGTVTATATPLHRGRTQTVVQTDLIDGDGRLLARTTQVQAVLDAR
jgi:1,4-dihydroxy-2-naphthoyl-CoA hydrolase